MSYTVGSTRVINTTSASGTTDFTFTFPYIKEAHIEVYNNYTKLNQGTGTGEYQVITNVSPKLIRLGTGIPSANVRIEIRRNSSLDSPLVDYRDGATLTANDLDTSALQSLYIDQELKDSQFQTVTTSESTGLPSLGNKKLTEVADPTAAQDAATKSYTDSTIDTKIDSALTDDIAAGSSISITDNSPSSGKVTLNVIAATGSNSGSMSASDKSKLDGIETGATADQTNAEIRAAVEAASDSNVFTDADHTKLNAIEANATADQTNAEIRAAVEAASDSNVFTDADHTKLNAIQDNATADQTASEIKTLLQSDKLTSSEIATGALDGRYYTETESDARYFNISTGDTIKDGDTFPDNDTTIATTAAINDRIIDLVDDVGGFVPIANETSFPNANPDVNNGAGTLVSIKALGSNVTSNGSGVATISNGTVGNSTVTITGLANSTTYAATFGMIVETTSTLNTYTFHRLVPKATEVTTVAGSISNVNTVAGAISNVNTVAGNNANITTVAGINANVTTVAGISSNVTSVAGNSTNINAVNSNATNINTVAGAITNVNNVGGSIANVNTVATNLSSVNDFAARYRVASSAPTSSLDTGDLYFDTTGNELKVYNGSAWQGGVTATGNLLSKSGDQMTGNLTFSGSQTVDGRDVSVDGTKLDGIAANANNYTHPNHTGEVTSSADGATVVADNIIDEANLKVSNSPTNGYFLSAQSGNTGGLTWAAVPEADLTNLNASNLTSGTVATARLGTGTASGSNFLRGDGTWAAAGGSVSSDGSRNTIGGTNAGDSQSGATDNTLFGYDAGTGITSGDYHTMFGAYSGASLTTNGSCTFFGYNAGRYVTAHSNIGMGTNAVAGTSSTALTGTRNVGVGNDSGSAITSGARNVGVGASTNGAITTGNNNSSLGDYALSGTTTGSYNIGIGMNAAKKITTGSYNIGIGTDTFFSNAVTGDHNVGIGYQVLRAVSSGTMNFAVGSETAKQISTGSYNTAMGGGAMFPVTTGSYNTAFGYNACGEVTTGDNNTCLGFDAGRSASPSGNITTGDNVICLGNNSVTDFYCNDTSISSSDKRDKTDVTDFTYGLKWVEQLKPVTYRWDKRTWYNEYNDDGSVKSTATPDGSKKKARQHIGFLAQDVLAIEQADGFASKKDDMLVVNLNEDETSYGLKYERLVPVLVNAIKELSAKVETLETKVAALESA